MQRLNRKSAPGVQAGRVQRKNNWELTLDYHIAPQPELVIERKRPGAGYRHVLKQKDVRDFIALLPDWNELSKGLNAVVIASGDRYCFGSYFPGVVYLYALSNDLRVSFDYEYYLRRQFILGRLGVNYVETDSYTGTLEFTENTARAYLLLNTFLHELGHHHDAQNTKMPRNANRGESYAEEYARNYADVIWNRYAQVFAMD